MFVNTIIRSQGKKENSPIFQFPNQLIFSNKKIFQHYLANPLQVLYKIAKNLSYSNILPSKVKEKM